MRKLSSGFTLVELLVVIVLMTILLAIALPSFSDMVISSRFTSTAMQLKADLNQARSESIKRNVRVLLCARNTAGDDCVVASDWGGGWLVCADADKDGKCDAATADLPNPLLVRGPLKTPLTLVSGNTAGVPFNPNGTQSAGAAVDLTLTRPPNPSKRILSIANTGNITSK
jgi:type IV fimbrial biogenesis protein FimT